jgi:hypothetical protein
MISADLIIVIDNAIEIVIAIEIDIYNIDNIFNQKVGKPNNNCSLFCNQKN